MQETDEVIETTTPSFIDTVLNGIAGLINKARALQLGGDQIQLPEPEVTGQAELPTQPE